MSIYTDLAKSTLEMFLTKQELPKMSTLPEELLRKRAACFVSLHLAKNNALRGCIGTIVPVYKNLAGEIIANTIEAALHDSRFEPVKIKELKNIKYSVDVLSEPEEIPSADKLNPKKYGVIVKTYDGRSGLLLPNLEGVDSATEQINIAKSKAGIGPDENIQLYRFTSKRYE